MARITSLTGDQIGRVDFPADKLVVLVPSPAKDGSFEALTVNFDRYERLIFEDTEHGPTVRREAWSEPKS